MNTNELRLGNYVAPKDFINFDDAKLGFVNYRVGSLDRLPIRAITPASVTVEAVLRDCLFMQTVAIDEVVPIPLTEELLLKCGFEKISSKYEDDFYAGKILLSNDFVLSTSDQCYESVPVDFAKPLKYLHQLQNLTFTLTGEELKIELSD